MQTVLTRPSVTSRPGAPNAPQSGSVRKRARQVLPRRNFNLAAERVALIRSLRSAENNWFAMCHNFRDAGQHWLNIKAECHEQKISAGKWATGPIVEAVAGQVRRVRSQMGRILRI
jgi:hypothetical protein